jgi:solute carrier family 35 protein E1
VVLWYAGNTFYNVYNKTALNMLEAHWFVASAQLAVGVVLSAVMWLSGIRKMPNLTSSDLMKCLPIGLFASLAHCGTVLASAVGAVSFAQIVKACEPVFAAVVGLLIPPMDVKPVLAYLMLIPIVGGVGIACIKEGKGVEINVAAFLFASMANAAASLKGKLGSSVTKSLKADPAKNMDAANVYAVMNIISFCFTIPFVVFTGELSTLSQTWDAAVLTVEGGSTEIAKNIIISGLFFYFYNETAFAFTRSVSIILYYGRCSITVVVLSVQLLIVFFVFLLILILIIQSRGSCHIQCLEYGQASHYYCCFGSGLSRSHGTEHCHWVSDCHLRYLCVLLGGSQKAISRTQGQNQGCLSYYYYIHVLAVSRRIIKQPSITRTK